jgi:hypothetical protein
MSKEKITIEINTQDLELYKRLLNIYNAQHNINMTLETYITLVLCRILAPEHNNIFQTILK